MCSCANISVDRLLDFYPVLPQLVDAVLTHLTSCYDLTMDDLLSLSSTLQRQQDLQMLKPRPPWEVSGTKHSCYIEQQQQRAAEVQESACVPNLMPVFLHRLWHCAVADAGLKGKGGLGEVRVRVGGMAEGKVPSLQDIFALLQARAKQQVAPVHGADMCTFSPSEDQEGAGYSCEVDGADVQQGLRLTPQQLENLRDAIQKALQQLAHSSAG